MNMRASLILWATAASFAVSFAAFGQSGLPLPPKPLKPGIERPAPPTPERGTAAPVSQGAEFLATDSPAEPQMESSTAQTVAGPEMPPPPATTAETDETAVGTTAPSAALLDLQAQYEVTEEPPAEESVATRRTGIDGGLILRAVTGLVFICGLIVVLAWAARRFGGRTPLLAGVNLGRVLGRVHLSPKVSLHYVRSGGRVLVIAVTPADASLITEFDAGAFDDLAEETGPPQSSKPKGSFAEHLRTRNREHSTESAPDAASRPQDDLAGLQGDIERLRNHLRESAREFEES